MLPRTLEPEAMDTPDEARDYDAMGHDAVNARFVADFLEIHGPCQGGEILDVGTGTARIPIALALADARAILVGIDLADAMLDLARRNVAEAGLAARIRVELRDAKSLPFPDRAFEAAVSNSIVHHIPDPAPALAEMVRVLDAGGTLFVRDLARPGSNAEVARLVSLYAGGESPSARALFEASLHAALTPDEVRGLVAPLGLPSEAVALTSDRHWTLSWRRDVEED